MTESIQRTVLFGLLTYGADAWKACNLDESLFTGSGRAVFRAIEELHTKGRVVDVVTVAMRLGSDYSGVIDKIMAESWVSATALTTYADELRQQHSDMEARNVGKMLAESGDIQAAIAALDGLGDHSAQGKTLNSTEAMQGVWDDLMAEHEIGLSTGLTDLDKKIRLLPGDLILLGARPSQGKTALMLNIAMNQTCPVGIFSLEMTTTKLVKRMISSRGIEHNWINKKHGQLTEKETQVISRAGTEIQGRFFFNDTGGMAISAMETEARRMVKHLGVGLICVDYLQLITCPSNSRFDEVSEISRRLKAMAKNLNVPLLALCQLNRESADKLNSRAVLSHLRESGQLEQDADIVLFIQQNHAGGSRREIEVAKNRDGEIGSVSAEWQGQYQRFTNLSHGDWGVELKEKRA